MGPWQFVNPGDMTSGQMEKTEGPCALASPESWPQQDTGLETKRTKISLDFPCLSACVRCRIGPHTSLNYLGR